MGLAIVNRIVTDHGGRVRVEDNHPAGARMIVDLNALAPDFHPMEPHPVTLEETAQNGRGVMRARQTTSEFFPLTPGPDPRPLRFEV